MDTSKFIYDTVKILTRDFPTNAATLEKSKALNNEGELTWGNFSWSINNNIYNVNVNDDSICLRVFQRDQSSIFEASNELRLTAKFEGRELADIYSWLYNKLEKHKERLTKIYDLKQLQEKPLKDMIPTVSVGSKMDDLV